MQGSPKVIALLQKAVSGESLAHNQYVCDAEQLDNLGLTELAAHVAGEALEERGHLMRYVARLVFFSVAPKIEPEATTSPAGIKAMLEHERELERGAIKLYSEGVKTAWEEGDFVSAKLFQEILADEEGHENWLDGQLATMAMIGEQRYLEAYVKVAEAK